MPVAARRLLTKSRSSRATIQPTTPMTAAANRLGIIPTISSIMFCTGSSRPESCSTPSVAGRNNRITSQ